MTEQIPTLHVEFFAQAVENERLSREQNRPIFEDRELVRIKFPGDPKRVHVAPAEERYRRDPESNRWVSYRDDFPRHYELFKQGMEQVGVGTPISELPFLSESKRAELRAVNVLTAEHLAGLEGPFLDRLGMGGRALKEQAQAYLEKAAGGITESRFAAENEALRQQIASLQEQVNLLARVTPSPEAAAQAERKSQGASVFEDWADGHLRQYIEERTGRKPRANLTHATLVRMADDVKSMEEAGGESMGMAGEGVAA